MNKVLLMGRLTKDPEMRFTKTNKSLVQFTLAVNRRKSKTGETGADFIPIVAWEKLAEFCAKYLKKGQQISLVGKNTSRSWEDSEGKKHFLLEVVANEMFFADAKSNDKAVTQNDAELPGDDADADSNANAGTVGVNEDDDTD